MDSCLVCKGDTYPGLLMYQSLADVACDRITAAITRAELGKRPISLSSGTTGWFYTSA